MARNLSILAVVTLVIIALVMPRESRDADDSGAGSSVMSKIVTSVFGKGSTSPQSAGEDTIVDKGTSGEGLVLLKFGAPWCPPCRLIDKELETLDTAARIVKINVDESPQKAAEYEVSSIPRMFLLRDDKVVGDRTGFLSAAELRRWISDNSGAPISRGEVQQNPFVE